LLPCQPLAKSSDWQGIPRHPTPKKNIQNQMATNNSIEEIFFRFLEQFTFDEAQLDYSIVEKHSVILQALSDMGNSGTGIFDYCKRQMAFASKFGLLEMA